MITTGYGEFDRRTWTARLGTRVTDARAICGAVVGEAPAALTVRGRLRDPPVPAGDGTASLLAVRVDYEVAGGETADGDGSPAAGGETPWAATDGRSLLYHGGRLDADRTGALPWGAGGATGDALVDVGDSFETGEPVPVEREAPDGWADGRRRCVISFWMAGLGDGVQAVFSVRRRE